MAIWDHRAVTVAIAMCGASVDRIKGLITREPERVTCEACRSALARVRAQVVIKRAVPHPDLLKPNKLQRP